MFQNIKIQYLVITMGFVFSLTSCVSVDIPTKEYTLARTAQQAAIAADASKYAPKYFYRSKKLYMRAEKLFKDRYYGKAKKHFVMSRRYAERAETRARIKQYQSGDVDGF